MTFFTHRWVLLLIAILSTKVSADLPSKCEGLFTESSLALRDKQLEIAQKKLKQAAQECPESTEVSELLALVFKSQGKWTEAENEFQKLYRSEKLSLSKRAEYAFDLGVLAFLLNRYSDCEKFLREALQANVNIDASHFILGKLYHQQKNWEESKREFFQVKDNQGLKQLADYYYAHINFEQGNTFQGYEALTELSSRAPGQHAILLDNVIKKSLTTLKTEDRSQWVKVVGLASDYDSNVFTSPNTEDSNGSNASGTLRETLGAKLAYATSPTKTNRYITFYQGSVNYNTSKETQSGQFMAHELGASWTRGFLNRFQYGARLSGLALWQYRSNAFRPYHLMGNAGFFLKSQLEPTSYVGIETSFLPVKNYIDPTLSEANQRSGWEQTLRLFYNQVQLKNLWNPSFGIVTGLLKPNGKNFQGYRVTLEATNFASLSDQWYLNQSVAVGGLWFLDRPSSDRTDQSLSLLLRAEYLWDRALTLAGQIDFLRSFSSDSTYRYSKWVGGISATYLF